jgi:hypothetical protein
MAEIASPATPVGSEPMVQNRIDPSAQVSIDTALMPARERSFEAVLNEIVGTLSVTAQQRACVSTQSGDVRFEKFSRAFA